jgi:hypothetical protein
VQPRLKAHARVRGALLYYIIMTTLKKERRARRGLLAAGLRAQGARS